MRKMIIVTALLSGCAVSPKVQYVEIKNADDMRDVSDTFFLRRSVIRIEKAGETAQKDDAGNAVAQVSITSHPMEYRLKKFGIRPITNWRQKTVVNIVKAPNQDLISSIGVETTDQVAKSINSIGGTIVKVLTATAGLFSVDTCNLPVEIEIEGGSKNSVNSLNCAKVELGDLPPDVIETSKIPLNVDSQYLYYSACRDAKITLTIPNSNAETTKTVRVSDPNYVQMIRLPYKGAVTMHSQCGASVVTEAVAESNAAAVIDALATQGKAIKDAIDAAKKPGS